MSTSPSERDAPDPANAGEESTEDSAKCFGPQETMALGREYLVGKTIGQFTLKRIIGSGGMGTVYEAVQDQPRRRVAIKMMKRGITSRSALRRFEFESQLLARLKHPGIAQVYEAGTHEEDGERVPYFVMEYIANAKTVTEYADAQKLDTRGRLSLFIKVCEAIQHGHLKGIVHRDLKPGNILVDSSGQPRIIDFGVARSTDSDMALTTLQTSVGQLVGTLQYMSPEQVEADPGDIDARSDVYALGIILFELLTSQLPYNLANAAIHEAVRIVREEEPTRLSTINRHLRGDVETIALKALEKDRDRRYQSAMELERDLQRFLNDEPISARSPGAIDFLRRFAKKHKAAAISLATIFLVLVGAVIAISIFWYEASSQQKIAVQARDQATEQAAIAQQERDRASEQVRIAEEQRDRAELQERNAKAVKEFTTNMLASVNPETSGITQAEQMKEVLAQATRSVGEQFANQPLVEAEIRSVIGSNYQGMGLYEQADPNLTKSLVIYRRILGNEHPTTLSAASSLGGLRWQQAQYEEAEALWKETLEGYRRLYGDLHPNTLASIDHIGSILYTLGRFDEAEAAYREALEGRRRTLGEDSIETIQSIGNMGLLLLSQGKLEDAEQYFSQALEGRRRLLGEDHPKTLWSINSMGIVLRQQGKHEEATVYLRDAVEGHRRVLGDEHPSTLAAINNLANALLAQEAYEEAEPYYLETLEIRTRVLGKDHPATLTSKMNYGSMLNSQGRHAEAEPILREVVATRMQIQKEDHPEPYSALSAHSEALRGLGQLDEARVKLEQAYEGLQRVLGDEHPNTMATLDTLVKICEEQGQEEDAKTYRDMLEAIQAEKAETGEPAVP